MAVVSLHCRSFFALTLVDHLYERPQKLRNAASGFSLVLAKSVKFSPHGRTASGAQFRSYIKRPPSLSRMRLAEAPCRVSRRGGVPGVDRGGAPSASRDAGAGRAGVSVAPRLRGAPAAVC